MKLSNCFFLISEEQQNNNIWMQQNIITEDLYCSDIFNELFKYIKTKTFLTDYIYLTGKEIKELLPSIWNGLKYLKDNKNVYIFNIDFTKDQLLQLLSKVLNIKNEEDIAKLKDILAKNNYGEFISNTNYLNNNQSLILLNENIEYSQLFNITIHELIHYFQWNSGRSIYNFKQIQKFNNEQIPYIDIQDTLNFNNLNECKKFINSILSDSEYITYCSTIFNELKTIYKHYPIKIIKYCLDLLFEIIFNSQKQYQNEFKKYINNIILKIEESEFPEIDKFINNKECFYYLILIGYFKLGFNTIKNHLYGYYNKEKKGN